jgi:hypothetical protein
MQAAIEKGRLAEGSPIPNYVFADKPEYITLQLQLQVIEPVERQS